MSAETPPTPLGIFCLLFVLHESFRCSRDHHFRVRPCWKTPWTTWARSPPAVSATGTTATRPTIPQPPTTTSSDPLWTSEAFRCVVPVHPTRLGCCKEIFNSVVDYVGNRELATCCWYATQTLSSLTGPSPETHRRGRLRLRLRRGAERRRAPDGSEEAPRSRRGEEETDRPGMFS